MSISVMVSLFWVGVLGLVCGKHPMGMGLGLLGVSLSVGGIVGIVHSSWLGFLLALVYCGGVLVLFSYVVCIAPNYVGVMSGKVKIFGYFFLVLIVFVSFFTFWSLVGPSLFSFFDGVINVEGALNFLGELNGFILFFFGYVLTVVLVAVVKLCSGSGGGSLRPFNSRKESGLNLKVG